MLNFKLICKEETFRSDFITYNYQSNYEFFNSKKRIPCTSTKNTSQETNVPATEQDDGDRSKSCLGRES